MKITFPCCHQITTLEKLKGKQIRGLEAKSLQKKKKREKDMKDSKRSMESKSLSPLPEQIHIWADERGG